MGDYLFQHNNWMKVYLPNEQYEIITAYCEKAADRETGGIIIGNYTQDLSTAMITEVTGAPSDSTKKRFSFLRGTLGISKLLDNRWKENRYYLGEWHYHPNASAEPSNTDIKQIHKFAYNKNLKCPEPVMIIIGGNSILGWKISTHVSRQGCLLRLEKRV